MVKRSCRQAREAVDEFTQSRVAAWPRAGSAARGVGEAPHAAGRPPKPQAAPAASGKPALAGGGFDEGGRVFRAGFFHDVLAVGFDGAGAGEELVGNLGGGEAVGHEL